MNRHTGTSLRDQRDAAAHVAAHVSAQCRPVCRSKPLIQQRCAGVTAKREVIHA
jgi:hypothetical protein